MASAATPKPSRCIDPVVKYCQGCPWGYIHYPEWVETAEDLCDFGFESGCTLGYDQGRPEDEPTEAELKEFQEFFDKPHECTICSGCRYYSLSEGLCCYDAEVLGTGEYTAREPTESCDEWDKRPFTEYGRV